MSTQSILLEKSVGNACVVNYLNPGAMTQSIKGIVLSIADQWMEIKTNKGIQLVNTEFITNIVIN